MSQLSRLITLLGMLDPATSRVLHGGAEGADEECHRAALKLGLFVEVYPVGGRRKQFLGTGIVHPAMPPLDRNRVMVERCDGLIACPASTDPETRSRTWATIRFAQKHGKPVYVLYA